MACKHGNPVEAYCAQCRAEKKQNGLGPVLAPVTVPQVGITIAGKVHAVSDLMQKYRKIAKHLTEQDFKNMGPILDTLAKQKFAVPKEADLQCTIMSALLARRRPKLNGRAICVALPYRDDQRGTAIFEDARRVMSGTMCEIVILVPAGGMGNQSQQSMLSSVATNKYRALVVPANGKLRDLGIDAVYVSGGPFDNPNMLGGSRNPPLEKRAKEANDRHVFEEDVIGRAVGENLPVLGICGGSWRVAAKIGLSVVKLNESGQRDHAKAMVKPQLHAHTVEVRPYTMLNQILQTDDYLITPTTTRADQPAVLNANSVHWAQSVVPILSPLQPINKSATAPDGVTEAFEHTKSHFVVGIQWHPEYAMDGLTESGEGEPASYEDARRHRQILRALGDAARDGRAATTLQRHFRARIAARNRTQAQLATANTTTK